MRDPAPVQATLVTKIVLEVAAGKQPLVGSVIVGDGLAIPFRGWLELAAAIERARLTTDYERQES